MSEKKAPEFFTYYGNHSMCLNKEVMDALTEEDVRSLSQAEKDFFKWYKTSEDLVDIHSGTCFGPKPTQEALCKSMMSIIQQTE